MKLEDKQPRKKTERFNCVTISNFYNRKKKTKKTETKIKQGKEQTGKISFAIYDKQNLIQPREGFQSFTGRDWGVPTVDRLKKKYKGIEL